MKEREKKERRKYLKKLTMSRTIKKVVSENECKKKNKTRTRKRGEISKKKFRNQEEEEEKEEEKAYIKV